MANRIVPVNYQFRLPKTVREINYDLFLQPNLEEEKFVGKVKISFTLTEKRKYIALHQKNLNVTVDEFLKISEGNENLNIAVSSFHTVENLEMFVIETNEELLPGLYTCSLSFEGSLKDKNGLFIQSYHDMHVNRKMVIAKFEPTYARKVFPCFDEPGFKAEFSIKLTLRSTDGCSALTNMETQNFEVDTPRPGLVTITYAKTLLMPSHLVSILISNFENKLQMAKGIMKQCELSVYSRFGQNNKIEFTLQTSVRVFDFYSKLFQISYPLQKLDVAVVPHLVANVLSSWGLIISSESELVFDTEINSIADKLNTINCISQKLSNLWFGNLITMSWWDNLWVNLSFARFISYKASTEAYPEYNFIDGFLTEVLYKAFKIDAKFHSRPIVQRVKSLEQIHATFDDITNYKGASILRMLENLITPTKFYVGVSKYLRKYAYRNAEINYFLNIIQELIGNAYNIIAITDTWIRQKGFPVVNVKQKKTKGFVCYILTQKRFMENTDISYDPSESEFGYRWTIPITYFTSENLEPSMIIFDKDSDELVIRVEEPVEWIKINAENVGYYKVNYENTEWGGLIDVLKRNHGIFKYSDRISLIEDVFSLSMAGELDYSVALDLSTYLVSEQNYFPWQIAADKLKEIYTLLSQTDIAEKFRDYVRSIINVNNVTWTVQETVEYEVLRLRTVILDLACTVEHPECLEEVGTIFRTWINDPSDQRPHPDVRGLVYYYGMNQVGDEQTWDAMFNKLRNETREVERLKLVHGLAGIRSPYVLQRYLNRIMEENILNSQDVLTCIKYISLNPEGISLVWNWVRENWNILAERYTLNDCYLVRLIPDISRSFSTNERLNEIKEFFNRYPESGSGAIYRAQALETVEHNIKWLAKNKSSIENWLDNRPV